jgi:hypothetical protein
MEQQRCGHCRETKDLSEFNPSYRGRPGTWCKACNRTRYVRKRPPPPPEGSHRCGRCKEVKPDAEFYNWNFSWCRACYREWNRERHTPKSGATDEPRACAQCGHVYQPKQRRPSMYCSRKCKEDARDTSGRLRDSHLRRKYGITLADYERILNEQNGGCALCGAPPEEQTREGYQRWLHVDHDHETGRVRGLLCANHNLLIGRWGEDPKMLRKAAEYLDGLLF